MPAGKVDEGYSIEETATKEAKEETGFDVQLGEKIGIYQDKVDDPVKHIFEAKIIGGELDFPEDEILDAKWFTLKKILDEKDKMRVPYVWEAIEKFENNNLDSRSGLE